MKYSIIPVTAFEQNCSLLWCTTTNKGVVVDPGGDVDHIIARINLHKIDVVHILLTHGHIDHAGGTSELASKLEVSIFGPHIEDRFWIDALPTQSQMFGLPKADPFTPDRWLEHGDRVTVGDQELRVLHCPGHTPGHIAFFHQPSRLAIVGDVLFKGSIGRTDFPKGDHATLIRSIKRTLLPLGDDVTFLPGHGPLSTFGQERISNPFLTD